MLRPTVTIYSAVAGITALASFYALRVISRTSLPSGSQVVSSNAISEEFALSWSTLVVNPHHHVTVNDTRSTTISVPVKLSHEQILARFIVGFFGGHVFAPERKALELMGKPLVEFKELSEVPVSTHVWSSEELNNEKLPPIHSVLFGAFRIVDVQVSDGAGSSSSNPKPQYSFIDFAFGADDFFIAGVHRFFVSEAGDVVGADGEKSVTIGFAHTGCNPKENKPLGPDMFQTLHLWYGMLLFREGVVEVLRTN